MQVVRVSHEPAETVVPVEDAPGRVVLAGLGEQFAEAVDYITNVSPFPGAAFLLEGNGVGFQLEGGSGAQIVGGPLTIRNNGTGLLADGAGVVTLVSIPPGASTIQSNTGVDVDLRFGTRVTLNGVTVGTVVCDATVLTRPATVCP
jgi:hypothetical protein